MERATMQKRCNSSIDERNSKFQFMQTKRIEDKITANVQIKLPLSPAIHTSREKLCVRRFPVCSWRVPATQFSTVSYFPTFIYKHSKRNTIESEKHVGRKSRTTPAQMDIG